MACDKAHYVVLLAIFFTAHLMKSLLRYTTVSKKKKPKHIHTHSTLL